MRDYRFAFRVQKFRADYLFTGCSPLCNRLHVSCHEPIKKYPDGFANDNELAYKCAELRITKFEKIHESFVL